MNNLKEQLGVLDYVKNRTKSDANFLNSILSMYEKNALYSALWLRLLLAPLFLAMRPRKRTVKYFFFGTKYKEIILSLPRHEVCVIGGPRQIGFCIKNNISIISNMSLWGKFAFWIRNSINDNDISDKINYYQEKCNLKKQLRASSIIDISGYKSQFIVENDSLPVQRFITNIFRSFGALTVCIQHGVFQSITDPDVIDGWYCDRFICYDKYQKEIIANAGISTEKLKVGGFYSSAHTPIRELNTPNTRRICFLGQPWYKYGDDFKDKYLSIYYELKRTLLEVGYVLYYKPHPWEQGAEYLGCIENIFKGSMLDVIDHFDVFFSYTSTALLETSRSGRVSVQIFDEKFKCDRFSKFNYAYTIDSDEVNDSQLLLQKVTSNPTIPESNTPKEITKLISDPEGW